MKKLNFLIDDDLEIEWDGFIKKFPAFNMSAFFRKKMKNLLHAEKTEQALIITESLDG